MQNSSLTQKIGIFSAVFLVTSNMLGSGIYMLPATLAQIGGVAIIGWGITLIGIIAFALVMAKLSLLIPNGAGPYSYTRKVFGNYMGYQTNLIYSIANWVALVSMLPIIVGYLQNVLPIFSKPSYAVCLQIAVIWLFTLININGAKIVSRLQSIGFLIALVPILIIAIGGWWYFDPAMFYRGFNPSGGSLVTVVNGSFNDIIWAFIGVESACVVARLVKSPEKNIPRATIGGVIVAAIVYIAVCTVMLGIIPADVLGKSSSPLADTLSIMFNTKSAGIVVSIIAVVDCIGAMSGWFLVTGQTAQMAASENLFPKIFAKTNAKDMPTWGLIILAVFMSIVVLITISPTAQAQFNKIIAMSVLLYLVPYLYSALALLTLCYKQDMDSGRTIYAILAIVACIFIVWSIFLTDNDLIKYAVFTIILSVPLYRISKLKTNKEGKLS